MADTPTTTEPFSGAAAGKTVTFSELDKFRIQQDAKAASTSHDAASRPFKLTIGGR